MRKADREALSLLAENVRLLASAVGEMNALFVVSNPSEVFEDRLKLQETLRSIIASLANVAGYFAPPAGEE